MNKLQRNMIGFCSLLLVGLPCQALSITRLSGFSLVTGAALTKRAYDYVNYKEEDSIDGQMFPHSLEWYKNLAKKYPEAHLDQKKFKSDFAWSAKDNNVIGAHFSDLITIERAQEDLSILTLETDKNIQERIQYIAGLEAILLHEAGHIEHKHHLRSLLIVVGTLIPLEICYQTYMKRIPQAPVAKNLSGSLWNLTKSMPRRIGLFCIMSTISRLVVLHNSRENEKQADAFACKHADLSALHGYAQFMEKYILAEKETKANNFFNPTIVEMYSTHPASASRLVAIQQEIARRELAKIK